MNNENTRLEYEAPKLDVQALLPQVYVMATASCPTSGNSGGTSGIKEPECDGPN